MRISDTRSELPSQLRIYLVGMLVVVAAGAVFGAIAELLLGTVRHVDLASLRGRAIVAALLAAGFWAVGRFPHSVRLHQAVDGGAPFALSMAPVLGILQEPDTSLSIDLLVLAVAVALCLRAALVSSTALRTMLVGSIALAPVLTVALLNRAADRPTLVVLASVFQWSAAVLIATAAMSHVVYDLRRRLRLGPYELGRKLGEGGMGVVYEAKHALLRRRTAVKFVRGVGIDSEKARRFEREAQITSALSHANIVSLFDYGCTPDGVYYYAMEYIDGLSLHEVVTRDGPLPPARAVHVLRQVAAALDLAHGAGLIHRDIKAANIMLCRTPGSEDLVKVLDFGLAKEVDSDDDITVEGGVVGTPAYLAPEIFWGTSVATKAADVYAFGVLAYFVLTGGRPFGGETNAQVAYAHARDVPIQPSLRTSNVVPPKLDDLVLRCLSKDPTRRYADGAELRAELSGWDDSREWTHPDIQAWWQGPGSRLVAERERVEVLRGPTTAIDASPTLADATEPLLLNRKMTPDDDRREPKTA